MAEPNGEPGREENANPDFRVLERLVEKALDRRGIGGGGGGDGPTDGTDRRLLALETSQREIAESLAKLLERAAANDARLASIEAKLDAKATGAEVARIAGRVEALPTTWQMITLVIGIVGTILGGAFLLLKAGLPHAP